MLEKEDNEWYEEIASKKAEYSEFLCQIRIPAREPWEYRSERETSIVVAGVDGVSGGIKTQGYAGRTVRGWGFWQEEQFKRTQILSNQTLYKNLPYHQL